VDDSKRQGEHFQDAIERHRLALQTDLKKSTSLPSAMFDTVDPMLEARLCEATERIFRVLLEQEVPPLPVNPGELSLEAVAATETLALVRAAVAGAFEGDVPALTEQADGEFHAVLAETCARSQGLSHERAAALLRGRAPHDLDELAQRVLQHLAGSAPLSYDPVLLGELAARIAAAALAADTEARP
jgi:hypothetical protein